MIEVIALIFLCRTNGKLAAQKGLKPAAWKFYTVLAFIGTEILGAVSGVILFGKNNLVGIISVALVSAFGGYLIIKSILDNKPDCPDEDINRIGVNDLHPPRK